MDLLDFSGTDIAELYYNDPLPEQAQSLLDAAAQQYGEAECEVQLLRALLIAPESLAVLVSLYRFYYYQHRYQDTLTTAMHALRLSGARLGFPAHWRDLRPEHLREDQPMALVRFYLFALKGAAYVKMRLGELEDGEAMIDTVIALDAENRLGGSVLKEVMLEHFRADLDEAAAVS